LLFVARAGTPRTAIPTSYRKGGTRSSGADPRYTSGARGAWGISSTSPAMEEQARQLGAHIQRVAAALEVGDLDRLQKLGSCSTSLEARTHRPPVRDTGPVALTAALRELLDLLSACRVASETESVAAELPKVSDTLRELSAGGVWLGYRQGVREARLLLGRSPLFLLGDPSSPAYDRASAVKALRVDALKVLERNDRRFGRTRPDERTAALAARLESLEGVPSRTALAADLGRRAAELVRIATK
jgi:hypothetical protein